MMTNFFADEQGATAIEYGLIAALVAVGLIAVLGTLGTSLSGIFQKTADELDADVCARLQRGGVGEGLPCAIHATLDFGSSPIGNMGHTRARASHVVGR